MHELWICTVAVWFVDLCVIACYVFSINMRKVVNSVAHLQAANLTSLLPNTGRHTRLKCPKWPLLSFQQVPMLLTPLP